MMTDAAESRTWWVAVAGKTVGPVPTDTVLQGIETGRIPADALVCEVGASEWSHLTMVEDFYTAVARSIPPQAPVAIREAQYSEMGEEPDTGLVSGLAESAPAYGPADAKELSGSRHRLEQKNDSMTMARARVSEGAGESHDDIAHDEIGIDVVFDDSAPTIDWSQRFQSYFLVGERVALPNEEVLLESLERTRPDMLRHDEGLWNLALCLAFGSEKVANAAAEVFFARVAPEGDPERLAWICRTLLSTGFMPSGIPRPEGNRGVRALRALCPEELVFAIEQEQVS